MKIINRFNKWYDQQQEPKRFLLFMTYMLIAILTLQTGIRFESFYAVAIGITLFLMAIVVAVFRIL